MMKSGPGQGSVQQHRECGMLWEMGAMGGRLSHIYSVSINVQVTRPLSATASHCADL